MSENNDGEEIIRKGNEWEVVALTESAYAASPGPKQDILDNNHSNLSGDSNAETADAMFMSGHFGLSSSIHESLPLEPEYKEVYHGKGHDHDVPQLTVQQGSESDLKNEENLHIDGLISDEFPGIPQFDVKGKEVANPGASNVQKHIEEDKSNEQPDLPCEVWWRKNAVSLYGHVKNANPYWSIVVAAAVMGLVIIGHRWQRDKPQVFHLRSQLVIHDEGFSHSQFH